MTCQNYLSSSDIQKNIILVIGNKENIEKIFEDEIEQLIYNVWKIIP